MTARRCSAPRFYAHRRRMTDQMVQATRTGARNISQGGGIPATSPKTEMQRIDVARAFADSGGCMAQFYRCGCQRTFDNSEKADR